MCNTYRMPICTDKYNTYNEKSLLTQYVRSKINKTPSNILLQCIT